MKKKKKYIESEIDKFLEKYGDKNISVIYGDGDNKIKFNTEKIIKSLKNLRNKFINFDQFNEEYNKFTHNVTELRKYKYENKSSFSSNKKKMERYDRDLGNIVDLYNLKSGSETNKKGEGLKIFTNKQMLNHLLILLPQIKAEIILHHLKMK